MTTHLSIDYREIDYYLYIDYSTNRALLITVTVCSYIRVLVGSYKSTTCENWHDSVMHYM